MKSPLIAVCLVGLLSALPACKRESTLPVFAVEAPAEPLRTEPASRPGSQLMRDQLLQQAETALQRNRLTKPPEDNAYDKFSAVLLLEPDNTQARAGLDVVLMELVNLAKGAMARNRLSEARAYVATINAYFPRQDLTHQINAQMLEAERRAQARNQKALEEAEADPRRHPVPLQFIRSDTESAKQWYAELAETIKSQDASVMIYARSDAEGRWIYKALKSSVPGYLIRGDIRISQNPVIQLLEPLP